MGDNDERRVVVVEDDFLIAEYLSGLCTQFGASVVGRAARGYEAIEVIKQHRPNVVLMDMRLADEVDGVDVIHAIQMSDINLRIIFITGSNEPPTIQRIESVTPHRVLIKPIDPEALRSALF